MSDFCQTVLSAGGVYVCCASGWLYLETEGVVLLQDLQFFFPHLV